MSCHDCAPICDTACACLCHPVARPPPTDPAPPLDPLERIACTLDNILGEVRGLRADMVQVQAEGKATRADVDALTRRVAVLERRK